MLTTTPSIGRSVDPVRQSDPRREMLEDELAEIVAFVQAKFPHRPRAEIAELVCAAYRHLQAGATVSAHLIPLTLNRSLRLMREPTDAARCSPLGRRTG